MYQYVIKEPVIIHGKFDQLCRDHDQEPSLDAAEQIVSEDFHAAAEPYAVDEGLAIQVFGGPQISDYLSMYAVVLVLGETILKYAEPGRYTIEDTYGSVCIVNID